MKVIRHTLDVRCKTSKLFIYFLTVLSLQWIIFVVYICIDSQRFSIWTDGSSLSSKNRNNVPYISQRYTSVSDVHVHVPTINYTHFQNCTRKNVRLSETPLPTTGLVSFPGTGSTWLRHLVQQMTGIGTSSMYCDGLLKRDGFPYECLGTSNKSLILSKTHEEKHFKLFKKIVLLVRNPYEALLAYFSWAKGGHTARPSRKTLLKASNELFNWSLWWYVDLVNGTLTRFNGQVHIVQYERLKTNLEYELRKLASFLQVNVTLRDLACTVRLQEGNFHRNIVMQERIDLVRTIFNIDKLSRLRKASETTRRLIQEHSNLNVDVGSEIEKILF